MTFQEKIDDGYYVAVHKDDSLYQIYVSQRSKSAMGGMGKILACPEHIYASEQDALRALERE